eukprot:CAMPEP_0115078786 /NCGR_PEP_ID=MMETSP0227-20121206/17743_1 /TAXON_ID=89957 /ORGANISM="Polarella glacialis, Strain CCMP 1383" /LENGTH=235 /DNA_ID=CAMNT_0002466211 /DNA_START=59 /DNA_END=763 /DNA_ORIENTATION=-
MGIIEDFSAKLGLKDSKQLLLLAGGAALVGVFLFAKSSKATAEKSAAKDGVDLNSKEGVLQMLTEMSKSQVKSRTQLRELATEVRTKSLSLSQTCQRYKEMKVVDPLDKYGLSMVEFNRMLAQHEADAAVQQAITVVMGSPPGGMASTEAGQGLTMKKIIEIHSFMLQEFEKLAAQADKGSRDPRTLTFAAQAVVTGKTEAAFSVTPEDIESAVLANHGALDANPEFSAINVKLQ